ncbi:hypothetical protein V8G54_020900 [Vigna mungo]|uniref:Uncharacterized protein n=1 Tax=Vigna mungo TaxID=3915 RepID=A0AAQ3RTT3_VIGMU
MKYEGQKLSFSNILDDFHYDREMAVATMVRPEMQGQRVKTVGCLNINDRLLHYVIVHMLTPRPANFAKVLQEDIFMIWLIKNNVLSIGLITSCNICLNARPVTHPYHMVSLSHR